MFFSIYNKTQREIWYPLWVVSQYNMSDNESVYLCHSDITGGNATAVIIKLVTDLLPFIELF